jgi:3-hydroxyisobutyrate dehydrogenase
MSEVEVASLGFVGLGNMGSPMALRMAKAGHRLRVFDVSSGARERLRGVPGITVTDDLTEIGPGLKLVFLMLPDSAAVDEVVVNAGLMDRLRSGSMIVDMGSSKPARTRELSELGSRRGIGFADAPVSGGVAGAASGKLTVMVGGNLEQFEQLEPILLTVGARIVHCGAAGAGHALKALNNLMSATHLLVTAEGMAAAVEFGLDPDVVLKVLNSSSGRSGSTDQKWPEFIQTGTYASGFGLRLMLKDMRTALELLEDCGGSARLSAASLQIWADAAEALPAGADHTEIARWLSLHI